MTYDRDSLLLRIREVGLRGLTPEERLAADQHGLLLFEPDVREEAERLAAWLMTGKPLTLEGARYVMFGPTGKIRTS